jgi:hypothetical protein
MNRNFGAVLLRPSIQLVQEKGCAVRALFIQNLVQRFHPLRSFLWIQIHNPLVQFLMHRLFIIVNAPISNPAVTSLIEKYLVMFERLTFL